MSFLVREMMALIDANDTAAASAYMVQYGLGHFQSDT